MMRAAPSEKGRSNLFYGLIHGIKATSISSMEEYFILIDLFY